MSLHRFHHLLCNLTPLAGDYQVMYTRTDPHAIPLGDARQATVDVVSRDDVCPTGTGVGCLLVAHTKALPVERVDHQRDALTGTGTGQVKIVKVAREGQIQGGGNCSDLVVNGTKNEVGESVARRRTLWQAPVRRRQLRQDPR